MKKVLLSLVFLTTLCSSFAMECEVGSARKKITVNRSGNYSHPADGYVYMIKYNATDGYLALMIEGGPLDLNVTHEAYNSEKSFLSLNKKGEMSDIAISCE